MQSEAESPATEPNELEADPAKTLELKKLALEIAELERPWWKRPTYILAALPTLLAVAALSVGFLNGFFSAQLTKLENQKHDLEAQVREFEAQRADLHKQKDALATQVERFTKQREQLERVIDELMKRKDTMSQSHH